jgi:toxin ParE1/3/4
MTQGAARKPCYLSRRATQDLAGLWFNSLETWARAKADRCTQARVAVMEAPANGMKTGRPVSARVGRLKRSSGSHVLCDRDLPGRPEVIRILHGAQDVERHLRD